MTVRELYDQSIKCLPTGERLQLAAIILNDIPPQAVVDYSETWSEEDLRDFSQASWNYIDKVLTEAGDA